MIITELKERFAVKPLPYDADALQPAISSVTLDYHYGKHYIGYLANLNRLVEGTPYEEMSLEEVVKGSEGAIFNNAAQTWNHEFYFEQLNHSPKLLPEGDLLAAINHSFGDFNSFEQKFREAASTLFGSGWVWLVEDPMSSLIIEVDSNAGTPLARGLHPLMTVDLWEHAYYLDYQNRRADAVDAHLRLIDWAVVERRYKR